MTDSPGWLYENIEISDEQPVQRLYNVENLGRSPEWVMFVDSRDDVNAAIESDLEFVVSFDGGLSKSRKDAIGDNWDLLKPVKKFILAGTDLQRREEIAKRVGRHRVFLVKWPAGRSNASDTLRKDGVVGVRAAVEAATPYPIEGLYRPTGAALLALRGRVPPQTMTTGTASTDAILRLPTEGRLIVVTGYPASGKTSWVRHVMVHTAKNHGRKWAVFSPEMMPWENFAADCAEVYSGMSFWPSSDYPSMSEVDIGAAGAWLESWLTMIVADSEDKAPTLEWLLECASDAVLRDGVTDVLLDPWNEVEHARDRNMTETDYIGRSLQQLKAFSARHGCNGWIIAHPAKPYGRKSGEAIPPPGPYDIASSAHWANKPDLGLTVHTVEGGRAELHLWKARFRRFGVKNAMAEMTYNPFNGRYSDLFGDIAPAPDWRKPYQEDD